MGLDCVPVVLADCTAHHRQCPAQQICSFNSKILENFTREMKLGRANVSPCKDQNFRRLNLTINLELNRAKESSADGGNQY